MLVCHNFDKPTDLYCDRLCIDLHKEDFLYYDKDGFELNRAEQKYYTIMGHSINRCLNHPTYTKNWYTSTDPKLIIDHSLVLFRCEYRGDALRQLKELKKSVPQAGLLIKTRAKWGFDFALDSVDHNGDIFEVLHIEYDTNVFSQFCHQLNLIQEKIDKIDWYSAADSILQNRDKWESLQGFAQNDWKAKFILNWSRAEYTEKAF